MFKDYQLIDQPVVRGIVLALSLMAISGGGFVAFFVVGFPIQMVFRSIPGLGFVISIPLVLAITGVLIRVVIDEIVIGSKNQVLTFSMGDSPLVLLALVGLVTWLSYPPDAEDPMGAVLPAFVGVNMTIYSLIVFVLGAWEIIAANRMAKTNNARNS